MIAAFASVAQADEPSYQPAGFIAEQASLPEQSDANAPPPRRLSLAEAISVAAKNNLGLVLEREAVRVGELNIDVARGIFEPSLTGSYAHTSADLPPQNTNEGGVDDVLTITGDNWRVGAQKRFSTGTNLALDFQNNRSRSSAANAVSPVNYRTTAELRLTQPLLRGFSFDLTIPKISVLRAELASEAGRARAQTTLSAVTAATETSYWSLVRALKRYQVTNASLDLARSQMELSKRQIEAGVLAPSAAIEAETTLAQRELARIRAQTSVEAAQDALRAVLNLPRARWSEPLLPTDTPNFEPSELSASEALEAARKNRPEIAQRLLSLKSAEYDRREAANNRLPQIDLALSYSLVGQDDRYRDALSDVGERAAPAWGVFLSLEWTPTRRATRAASAISASNVRVASAQHEQAILSLFTEVRDALRNLDSANRELLASARFRQLAERSLDAEQRKFAAGTSSNYLVAERGRSVAEAQLAELDSLINHKTAKLALLRATGELLEKRNVTLEVR